MKAVTALIGGVLIGVAPSCLAQLKVDFDVVDTNGTLVADSVTDAAFQSFGVLNQTNGTAYDLFRTVAFSTPSWGSVNVTMSSDANSGASDFNQVPRAIARTASQMANYLGTSPGLVRDWVGIDTRATNAAPTKLNLTISALPAGNYELISYHQDPADQNGRFDVLVNGTEVATNLHIRSSQAGQGPLAGNPPFFVVTPFTSDGSTPTAFSFRLTTSNSVLVGERLMVLNGFIVANRGQGLLIYSFDSTPAAVFQGQTATLSWLTRSNALVYVDLLGDVTASTTNGAGSATITPSSYYVPGTTNLIALTAQDTNTFEADARTISIRVLNDLESFRASPVVIHSGESSTLSWIANPGGTITINQGIGSVNAQTGSDGNGSFGVSPTTTTTYTISVTYNSVTTQSNVTVTVIPSGGTGTLTNGLIAYWPMDEVQGTKTPELTHGYDLNLEGTVLPVLTNVAYRSNAFYLTNGLLGRVHAANDLLPANKSKFFSISLWTKANGPPLDDKRIFCEGSTTDNDPFFTFGTMGGLPGDQRGNKMSVYIRNENSVVENAHTYTSGDVFDDTWHHVVFVQSNRVRMVYVDTVPDSTAITNASSDWYTNVFNTTAFGAAKRAGTGNYITGFIDDAAIWNRALSPAEIGELYLDGLNLNPIPAPLTIHHFAADFPAVVAGDTIRLSWDASSDATLSIDNGIGDVTGISLFGVGSTNVVVTTPTSFTLTASRTGDTPVTQTVSVSTINGVAAGWHLLDNFETYQPGAIQGQPNQWIQTAGLASVLDLGDNNVLDLGQTTTEIVSPGGLLAALSLNSLSLPEGEIGTLFFRICVSDNDPVSALTLQAGLSDRPTGWVHDWETAGAGPYMRLEKPATLITNITVLAPDGYSVARVPGSNVLSYAKIYNIWINVTNDVIASNDVFSVYAQAQGEPSRTLLHQNRRGDRNPNDPTYSPVPTLNKIFFLLVGQNQAKDNVFIDDIYLSLGSYLDTVPVPPGTFTQKILLSSAASVTGGFRFSWNSQTGTTYTVRSKDDLTAAWQILATNYPAGGAVAAVTSYTNSPLTSSQRFYQAVAEPRPAVWSDDFEAGSTGWVVLDNSGGASPTVWAWGTPSNGPGAAHSGTKAFGTGLAADYAQYTDTSLRSPVIDLTGLTNQVRLEFWQYLSVEATDIAQVNVLDQYDTVIAQPAAQQSGSPGGWTLLTFPLPTAALNQPIKLEFRMADADYYNAQSLPGWFIDDVVIRR